MWCELYSKWKEIVRKFNIHEKLCGEENKDRLNKKSGKKEKKENEEKSEEAEEANGK